MKLFGKKIYTQEKYKIAFCDTPSLSTKFGEWHATFDTYSSADCCIRMGWGKAIERKVDGAYELDDGWLVIEKVVEQKVEDSMIEKIRNAWRDSVSKIFPWVNEKKC